MQNILERQTHLSSAKLPLFLYVQRAKKAVDARSASTAKIINR